MTVTIARHGAPGPNAERFAEAMRGSTAASIERLESAPVMIDATFTKSLLNMRAQCTVDARAAKLETWESVVTAMQLGSAMFALTGGTGGVVETRIDHKVRHIPEIGPRPYADAGNWLTAFWLAIVCRDQKRMTRLCEIPLDRLRSPEGAYDEYVYHWVDALQTYWLQGPGLVEKLTAAIEGSSPDVATTAPRDLLQQVLYPPIDLFYRFLRQDRDGFDEALAQALSLHKLYWTADEDRAKDAEGRIALAPLAIACLAHDGGIPVDVESEYLPHHLLQRSWLGEFET
ncbi:immunity 49 family protein [Streptomyces sp. DH24]|uniref:immunity 49 family protein n=1 Tax=Streptomyces sp. DH24 TaxID=3040123 RepID=UPI00244163F7|nr:immunity 49 family protein [Streptomyces sp. DH24]MDG9716422.1 immunity 49 family protein [Streptomyces sp. DH24]